MRIMDVDRITLRTAPPPPKTMTKEWQEASNQRAIEQKMNPITGMFLFFALFPFALSSLSIVHSNGKSRG
jgi:hypothetical protein